MTEQAKVPAIRFAGFTDPWEQRKLGEFGSVAMCKRIYKEQTSEQGDVPFFKIGTFGADPDAFISNELFEDYKRTYPYPTPGTLLISAAGSIGRIVEYQGEKAYFQDSNIVWLEHEHRLNDAFLKPLYSKIEWGLEGSTIKRLYNKDLLSAEVTIPDGREQKEIGQFFAKLDDLITLHQRKYDKLVVFKKSMLEKMFPKDGESVPEIRFAGFTDPWEQRKLGDVASSFDYGLNAAATEYDGQNKYLRITDIDDETHEFSKSDLTTPLADLAMSADYLLKESDLLFARTGASVGKTYLYRQFDGMVYFAGFLIRARIGEGADPEFAYQATLTDAYKKYVAITSQRSGQPGVNAQEYADYQLMLPSKTEQQQIGMTLRSLDDLITLHQRKLELLRNIKKSLLDKMFV
ncbi:restriction endonuclease subunit S [Bifidobacterium bifidum]|uniref:restriction endonuclease subunit S n=2 Tax=Bifidobacterium TaxID=1678 RepID=UPI0032C1950E